MGRKKNSFSKAINHLKSNNIDEKLEMLNEIPTNNTSGLYSVVPGSSTISTTVTNTSTETVPDFSTIDLSLGDNPANSTEAYDTSGIFDETGTSKLVEPPGDKSYILGPMSSMWYAWGNFSTIGYIRESDRRMVNLGTITGKLSDWDQQEINSYGQLTLEQAVWFYNTPKRDNAGNDPANANYRALYPGPPSNPADVYGRYLSTIVGTPRTFKTNTTTTTSTATVAPMELQGTDNFSAIVHQLMNSKPRLSDFGAGRSGRAAYNRALRKWEERLAAAEKAAGLETTNPIFNQDNFNIVKDAASKIANTLWQGAKIVTGAKAAEIIADLTLNPLVDAAFGKSVADSAGDYNTKLATSLTTSVITGKPQEISLSPKARKDLINSIDINMLSKHMTVGPTPNPTADNAVNPGKGKQSGLLKGAWGNQGGTHINYDPNNGKFTITSVKMLRDFGNLDQKNAGGKITNFEDIPNPSVDQIKKIFKQKGLEKPLKKFYNTVANLGVGSFRPIAGGFNPDEAAEMMYNGLPKMAKALYNFTVEGSASNAVHLRNQLINAGVPQSDIEKMGAGFGGYVYNQETYVGKDIPGGVTSGVRGVVTDKMKKHLGISESKKILLESRKKDILKTLKEPIVIPETKQKKYKVRVGRKLKKSKTNFQGMDKLIGDVKPLESFKKRDVWSHGWQEHNARLSQDKKNIVLEKIGEGKRSWDYMIKHGNMMNAKNLEEFWGKNPDFYSYYFNGKKYNPIRKEQVKGDYIVFLVDEFGEKSSILQSELNLKLIEDEENKMLAEYNKLNNVEPISYKKDPLFKKVSNRLSRVIDYPDKPAVKGYPNEPPPELDPNTGMHPKYGKKSDWYKKLDSMSANAMPSTGDSEIDAVVDNQRTKRKEKKLT